MLTAKQKKFCDEYVTDLNATQAAIRAGYSKKTAYAIGWENLRKPEIRTYIDTRLKEFSFTADETTKLITDIARSNLGDYFVTRKVERTPRIVKPLKDIIEELKKAIAFEEEYLSISDFDAEEIESYTRSINSMRRELKRKELVLKHNPKATEIVNGETVLVETVELDMKKLVEDKQRGRIKSIEPKEFGLKVELYDASAALTNIAKMQGLFEKDNQQKIAPTQLSDNQFAELLKTAREAKSTAS